MKITAAVLGCLVSFAATAMTEWHWIGADGDYSLNANTWQTEGGTKGVAKGADAIAVFDDTATINWANDNNTQPIGGIKVLAGTVTFTSSYGNTRNLNFANLTNEIYIAPGATLVLNGHSPCGTNGSAAATQVVRLTGGGTLRTNGNSQLGRVSSNNLLSQFVVGADTTLELNSTADGVMLDDALVVEAGGVAKMLGNNLIQNNTVIRTEAGGAFLASGQTDTLGAFTGDGLVVFGAVNLTLPASKGPFAFGGVMTNAINKIESPDTAGDDRYILLTSTDAFAATTVTAPNPTTTRRFIRFAPGVGTFKIKSYAQSANEPLHLEDTDGEPVTVRTMVTAGTTQAVTGSGNLVLTHGDERSYGGAVFSHTGWLLTTAGSGITHLGTLSASTDSDLTALAGFDIGTGSTLSFKQSVPTTITQPVTGGGKLYVGNSMTFEKLRMDGDASQLTADNDAVVTLKSPTARLKTITGSSTSDIVVDGGYLSGPADNRLQTSVTHTIDSTLSITNCDLQASTFQPGAFFMTGGKLILRSGLTQIGTSAKIQRFVFNGGTVQLGDGNYAWDSLFKTVTNAAPWRSVSVGANGLKIRVKNSGMDQLVSFGTILSACKSPATDGGLSVGGYGPIRVDATKWETTGPAEFDGGYYLFGAASFGALGPVTLKTGLLKYAASAVTDTDLSVGTTTLSGATTLYPKHTSTTAYGTFKLGALAQTAGGVLFLKDELGSSCFFDGTYTTKPPFTTAAQLAHTAAGATKIPVFGFSNKSPSERATSRYHMLFLKSLTDGSFEAVAEKPWSDAVGATDIVTVDSTTETKMTTDHAVGGLTVYGRSGSALTLNAGTTLTVGDGVNPAAVLLHNNHLSGRGTCQVTGAGAIDFGTSEGIVAANLQQSGSAAAIINCVLKGSSGVTFAGAVGDATAISVGGANTYTGGTYVNGAIVTVGIVSGFGTGPVRIAPAGQWGGEVKLNVAGTFANDFTLGGHGVSGSGCLYFSKAATVSGTVALQGDVGSSVGAAYGVRGTLNNVISGVGPLMVASKGTVVFAAANTFTGGLTIGSDATVALAEGATPGADTVTVKGTLRFENTSPLTVAWKIVGTGRIVMAGSGTVKLTNAAGFTGQIVTEGAGTYDLAGGDLTVSEFDSDGSFVNSGEPATLTLDNARPATFGGAANGPLALAKKGAGVQYLTGHSTYTGATLIEGGTLVVGDPAVSATLPVSDTLLRLDANVGVTCETDSDRVASWADADGKDIVFENKNYQSLATPNAAKLKTEHINGLSAVYFDHSLIRYMASGVACSLRTYFGAIAYGHDGTATAGLDGVFGKGAVDSGVRVNGSAYNDGSALTDRINGVAGSAFTKGTPHLLTRTYSANQDWASPALGDYSNNRRPMSGDMCEIIVYNRVLGTTERSLVENYLMSKWALKEVPAAAKYTDVLPAGTDLTVASGATFDLNGNDQTLGALDLAGTLTNGVSRLATLTLTEDSFIRAGASFGSPNLDLVLADGVVLDLGGGTYTIRRLTGSRSRIVNGTLIETKPRGGLMLLVR